MKNLFKSVSASGNPARFVWQNNNPSEAAIQREEAKEAMKESLDVTGEIADKMVDLVLLQIKAGKESTEAVASTLYEFAKKGAERANNKYEAAGTLGKIAMYPVGIAKAGSSVAKYPIDAISYLNKKTGENMQKSYDYIKEKIDKIF